MIRKTFLSVLVALLVVFFVGTVNADLDDLDNSKLKIIDEYSGYDFYGRSRASESTSVVRQDFEIEPGDTKWHVLEVYHNKITYPNLPYDNRYNGESYSVYTGSRLFEITIDPITTLKSTRTIAVDRGDAMDEADFWELHKRPEPAVSGSNTNTLIYTFDIHGNGIYDGYLGYESYSSYSGDLYHITYSEYYYYYQLYDPNPNGYSPILNYYYSYYYFNMDGILQGSGGGDVSSTSIEDWFNDNQIDPPEDNDE